MILVLNCGSQSIKWKLFRDDLKLIKYNKREVFDSKNFGQELEEELKVIGGSDLPITLIGHRVVHGGGFFSKPLKITAENFQELEKINYLAPSHNPYNILGIKACQSIFKSVPQIAVFDTEFFKDLPEKAFTYALPENIAKQFNFRRFGFHGISHEFVSKKLKGKVITCHLGGGASITAIKNGKAVDTSMGFTPMEGLVMMTRPGNIDAGVVLELVKNFSVERASEILNKESGLKGICGESDMLKLLEKIKQGDKKAKLALDIFVYSIQKYIGSYYAILGGCDLLVFTGAIGFGSAKIRNMILKDLDILKKTKVLVIETDEELAIAEKIKNLKI